MDSFKGINFYIFDLTYGHFPEIDYPESTPPPQVDGSSFLSFQQSSFPILKRHISSPTLFLLWSIALGIKNLKRHQTKELFETGVRESSNQGTAAGLPVSTLSFPCLNLVLGTGQLGPFLMLSNDRKFSGLKK